MTDSNQSSGERDAIVAWLRGKITTMRGQMPAHVQTGEYMEAALLEFAVDITAQIADAIQRGDHLPSPPTQDAHALAHNER